MRIGAFQRVCQDISHKICHLLSANILHHFTANSTELRNDPRIRDAYLGEDQMVGI